MVSNKNRLMLRTAIFISLIVSSALLSRVCLSPSNSRKNNIPNSSTVWKVEALPPVENAIGPETYAFDPNGDGPYTGVSDGRIVKWLEDEHRWIDFAVITKNREGCGGTFDHEKMEHICGRPLGLAFEESSGDLYIADAYFGLLRVGPQGGVASVIATDAEGIPFKFTNSLAFDPATGILYFVHSSSKFDRRDYFTAALSADGSGRLLEYDSKSNEVRVLVRNLKFPCGLSLSHDGNYLLIPETVNARILKYWLKTPKAETIEGFAQLQGFPDNINPSPRGGYWVALYGEKDKTAGFLQTPWIAKILLNSPINIKALYKLTCMLRKEVGMGVRLSENGDVLETFQDENTGFISEITEEKGYLWIGSIKLPFTPRYKL
ncbi:hypothetical protein ACFE04_013497 [Oxalis oulophora]